MAELKENIPQQTVIMLTQQLCHVSRNICSQDVRPALKEVSTLKLYFKERPSCRGQMGRK
jgi:hypothetical protein